MRNHSQFFSHFFRQLLCLFAWALLMPASPALAAKLSETPAQTLTRISEETAVLMARQARLAATLKLLSTQNEISRLQNGGAAAATTTMLLTSVDGIDGTLVATLQLDAGFSVEAKQGETVSGGWKVISITAHAVILSRGGQSTRLLLGQGSGPAPTGTAPGLNVPAL
jgi:type IV pilus biogenesis protein PilP